MFGFDCLFDLYGKTELYMLDPSKPMFIVNMMNE